MELITTETRRPRKWYYCDGMYIAKDGDDVVAKIAGVELIDPETIAIRRKAAQHLLPLNRRGLYRVQPDPVTVALWNDWQRR